MQEKLEKIYEKYYQTVFKYLICLTKNTDIAEELTQETFYKMIKKINTYKGNCKFSVWLCEIAKNTWYDELRKNKRKLDYKTEENLSSGINIEEDYISKEKVEEVYQKIEKFDRATKRVMFLRINSELSFKQIGDILGRSETWARVTFYRAKQRIKEDKRYEKYM